MIYLTSDLHGKHDELMSLLDHVGFSDRDWLWIIGDVIDRNGDGGVRTLKWLLDQPNVQLILGNHEHFLLSNRWLFEEVSDASLNSLSSERLSGVSLWQYNGGDVTMRSLRRELPEVREDILGYLEDCPIYERVSVGGRKYILVHGGLGNFYPEKPLESYSMHELLWERPTLATRYSPEKYTVILGHTPTFTYSGAYKNRMIRTNNGWWNIDTGAARDTGRPMLLCLDTLDEYYIENGGEIIRIENWM